MYWSVYQPCTDLSTSHAPICLPAMYWPVYQLPADLSTSNVLTCLQAMYWPVYQLCADLSTSHVLTHLEAMYRPVLPCTDLSTSHALTCQYAYYVSWFMSVLLFAYVCMLTAFEDIFLVKQESECECADWSTSHMLTTLKACSTLTHPYWWWP